MDRSIPRAPGNLAKNCSHEDSRLSCIDCSAPICGNCLVQCPVGFRCRGCVGGTAVPSKSESPMRVVKTLGASAVVGAGGGFLIPLIAVPFLACIICYFMGSLIGRGLSRVIDYTLGPKLTMTVTFGLLIGMSLTPLGSLPMVIFEMLKLVLIMHGPLFATLNAIVGVLFSPVCFVVGVLRATVWGGRW